MINKKYTIAKIPKGKGQHRTIYVPSAELKKGLGSFLPALQDIHEKLDDGGHCHAFLKGRNCVTNANKHIGFGYTVSFDVANFFDSVRAHHLAGKVPLDILENCLIAGVPRQGLPTSPLLASIALIDADKQIRNWLSGLGVHYQYTRYADDIAISLDGRNQIPRICRAVEKILASHGFELNARKTRVQSKSKGRIIITGISVGSDGVYPTRKTLKKLRAARHQGKLKSAAGLLEWSKCKLPNGQPRERKARVLVQVLTIERYKCDTCSAANFVWAEVYPGKAVLVDPVTLHPHRCPKGPQKTTQQTLRQELLSLGFKKISMASKTWLAAYFFEWHDKRMLVLFRKKGIDLCLSPIPSSSLKPEGRFSLQDSYYCYRLGYQATRVNVNNLVSEAVSYLCPRAKFDLGSYLTFMRQARTSDLNDAVIFDDDIPF